MYSGSNKHTVLSYENLLFGLFGLMIYELKQK